MKRFVLVAVFLFVSLISFCVAIDGNERIAEEHNNILAANQNAQKARGTVFHDKNANGVRDKGEPGLPGVRVSDQISVTVTDDDGNWELPGHEVAVYFVIKPRGYMTALSTDNVPRFYYLHRNKEPMKLNGPTIPRSGPLPASIDFPLIEQEEPEKFEAIFMGDAQPSDIEQVNFLAHDVLEELISTDAAFAVTLGDLTNDVLGLYPAISQACGTVGIPFYNTPGNHDANYDGQDTHQHYETWRTTFGPSYYSFDYGPVHFVILNDVRYPEKASSYHSGFGENQLAWLEQDLAHVPGNQLIVLSMHIPLKSGIENSEYARLYGLLKDRPNTMSFSAHTHTVTHVFLDEELGWKGLNPHHHIIAGASCGRWWGGNRDETNIPHATSSDGTPNGYFVVTFDGTKYSMRYKGARKPADYQMQIQAPDEVKQWRLMDTQVLVNIFNGNIHSKVKMAVGEDGKWIDMKFAPQVDPLYSAVVKRESGQNGSKSSHMWKGNLPAGLATGGHAIRIRTRDMHGQEFIGSRIIRVSTSIPLVNSSHEGMVVTKEKVVRLRLNTDYPGGIIRYTFDGSDPTENSPVAGDSIDVPMDEFSTKNVKFQIFSSNGSQGEISQIVFIPVKENYAMGSSVNSYTTMPSQKYAGGDISTLVNGKFGGSGLSDGWLGWEGKHADFIIDLGETRTVNRVFVRALTDENAWIFFPKAVKVYLSDDGSNWSESKTIDSSKPIRTYGFEIQEYNIKIDAISARYIRVFAENILKNPDWHKQPGGKSWIFMDEVIVD